MTAYFLGVWPGERAGHCCSTPDGVSTGPRGALSPWSVGRWPLGEGPALQAAWPGRFVADEPEGVARVVRHKGWTLVSLWDRSGDRRYGSHASFALGEDLDPAAALEKARELFPGVFTRIETHLGRTVVLDEGRGT